MGIGSHITPEFFFCCFVKVPMPIEESTHCTKRECTCTVYMYVEGGEMIMICFVMQVSQDCTWQLAIGLHHVEPITCSLLKAVSSTFSSVIDVLSLLSIIDTCKFCVGNNDGEFERIAAEHKGGLKNRAGEVL